MALVPFHPYSMEYTADPRPYFNEFHGHGQLVEHKEFGAWFAHDYDARRREVGGSNDSGPFDRVHLDLRSRLGPDGITWDPTNILLREITRMPLRVR